MGIMSEIQYREQIEKVFLSHLSDIRAKQSWKTHFDIEFSWDEMMRLLDTHPKKLLKWKEDKQKVEIEEFQRRPSAPVIAKDAVSVLHDIFIPNAPLPKQYNSKITNIVFVGFGVGSGSYPNHKDSMDVFLVQMLGEIDITISETNTHTMKQGDAVWIPRGTYHQIRTKGSRVTFSFGVETGRAPVCDPATYV